MSPFGVARSVFDAALLVLACIFAFQLLFAQYERREAWRSRVKRHIYVSQSTFKRASILLGWAFLFIAISLAYLQIDKLVARG